MENKGQINLTTLPIDINELRIYSKDKEEDFICHKYFYKNHKLIKHIDFINWRTSHYSYNIDGSIAELKLFSFQENPEESKLIGFKKFVYENAVLIGENYFVNVNNEHKLEYEGKFTYAEKRLIKQDFYYPNEIYSISYKFRKKNRIITKNYPDKDGDFEYHYDKNGYLKKTIDFKRNDYCKINEYEYFDGRLNKLIAYPILKYKKKHFSNKIELLQKPDFIHETEFIYDNGILIKEIKTDIIDNYQIEVLHYEYIK